MKACVSIAWLPRLMLLAVCGGLAACSLDAPAQASAGGSNSGVTMREVVGDFCPPAQATKGNC